MLKKITKNPLVNFFVATILVTTSGYECFEAIEKFELGAHHGVLIFGFVELLKSLPEVFEATKDIDDGAKTLDAK